MSVKLLLTWGAYHRLLLLDAHVLHAAHAGAELVLEVGLDIGARYIFLGDIG